MCSLMLWVLSSPPFPALEIFFLLHSRQGMTWGSAGPGVTSGKVLDAPGADFPLVQGRFVLSPGKKGWDHLLWGQRRSCVILRQAQTQLSIPLQPHSPLLYTRAAHAKLILKFYFFLIFLFNYLEIIK